MSRAMYTSQREAIINTPNGNHAQPRDAQSNKSDVASSITPAIKAEIFAPSKSPANIKLIKMIILFFKT